MLGFAITIGVGGIIIILSCTLEQCVNRHCRHKPTPANDQRAIARIADHTLQLQRMALLGAGYESGWEEETLLDHVPVTGPEARFVLPNQKTPTDMDYLYSVAKLLQPATTEMTQSTSGLGENSGSNVSLPQEHLSTNIKERPVLPARSGSSRPLMEEFHDIQ